MGLQWSYNSRPSPSFRKLFLPSTENISQIMRSDCIYIIASVPHTRVESYVPMPNGLGVPNQNQIRNIFWKKLWARLISIKKCTTRLNLYASTDTLYFQILTKYTASVYWLMNGSCIVPKIFKTRKTSRVFKMITIINT